MAENPPIVFKSEPALWAMLAECNPDGRSVKPFDMRRWDLADERIYRLAWGTAPNVNYPYDSMKMENSEAQNLGYDESYTPDEKQVSFVNKATGALLTFEYLGVMFAYWAPGWGFLRLGKRLHPPVEGEK